MTVVELKQELGQRGLKKTGNKKELIARLRAIPPPKRTFAGKTGQHRFKSAASAKKKTAGKKVKKTSSKKIQKTSSKRIPARSYKSARNSASKKRVQKQSPIKKFFNKIKNFFK